MIFQKKRKPNCHGRNGRPSAQKGKAHGQKHSHRKPCIKIKKFSSLALLFSLLFLTACDSKQNENPIRSWIDCQLLFRCEYENTRFGMIGDSWTDLLLGTQLQRDLYDWLTTEQGYRITAANIAGQTMQSEVTQTFSYRRVIKAAGTNLHFMLVSMGGNDMLNNISEYTPTNLDAVLERRLATYEAQFRELIVRGDAYKIELYGGPPMQWFIHGYDYPNPELISQCKASNVPESDRASVMQRLVDRFNERLQHMSYGIPNLHYIDLRGTLGGPPISDPKLKLDCIHPNDLGFRMLAARYARTLQLYTQER